MMRLRGGMLLCVYSGLFTLSLYLAYNLRFDFYIPQVHIEFFKNMVIWIVPFKLAFLFAFGQFSVLLTYFRLPDLFRIIGSMTMASLFLVVLWFGFEGDGLPPRAVILTDLILSIALLALLRLAMRLIRERLFSEKLTLGKQKLALIIGTGETAESLVSDLLAKPSLGIRPVAFLDVDKFRIGKDIHGIPILGTIDDMLTIVHRHNVDKIILALPRSERTRVREVIQKARDAKLIVEMIPSLEEIATGRVQAVQLRPVELEDLLGRASAVLDSEGIRRLVADRVVCVTGAGGSIGRELSRQLLMYQPRLLMLVDHSEMALFQVEQELIQRGERERIVALVADVGDSNRMRHLFAIHQPMIVFHSAAYKHVPMMEYQPDMAIRNNTLATARLAEISSDCGVERFVFISTDKAINPTSVMGASKRLAELYLQAMHGKIGNKCQFMAVRFGNVLGSSGSVIPTFKQQIAAGGPVTVTHPDVMRYFMTIPEAVGLVLQSSLIGKSAEILVLNMGEPMKIVDIARQLIRLSGYTPDTEIPITFVGLRPGEKLFEELQHEGESFEKTEHPLITRFKCTPLSYFEGCRMLESLEITLTTTTHGDEIKTAICKHVPEYQPYSGG